MAARARIFLCYLPVNWMASMSANCDEHADLKTPHLTSMVDIPDPIFTHCIVEGVAPNPLRRISGPPESRQCLLHELILNTDALPAV